MSSLITRLVRVPAGGLKARVCQPLALAAPPRRYPALTPRRPFSGSFKVAARHYTDHHEGVDVGPDGKTCTIGISKFVSSEIGDVCAATLPTPGDIAEEGDFLARIESIAMEGEFSFPVSVTVTVVNEMLADSPEIVNEDTEGSGWLAKAEATDTSFFKFLMSKDAYDDFTKSGTYIVREKPMADP